MSQPLPITPEPIPPLIVLTTFVEHLAAITSGAEPFSALERPPVASADDQAAAPDDSFWPRIPGTGKGVRYRTLTSILGDHFSSHAALISLWLDQARLLTPATDPERPWNEARLLNSGDLTQLAAQLKVTPLPTADQVAAAREHGLK